MTPTLPFASRRYRLLRSLLESPTRGVWLVHDAVLERAVVLKARAASPGSLDDRRLVQEYQRLRRLAHPALPVAGELFSAAGSPPDATHWRCFTSEWLEGDLLCALPAPLDPSELLALSRWLLETVGWLHDHGLCHLDLKPDHLLRCRGHWHLLDVMELAGEEHPLEARPPTGTLEWLAPEVIRSGQGSVRGDLFSAGRVLEVAGARRCPELVPLLEALLQPESPRRPPSASAALALLTDDGAPWRQAAPPPRPALVGSLPLDALADWLEDRARTGGWLEVVGPEGAGRSRALLELLMAWEERGHPALLLTEDPSRLDDGLLLERLPSWLALTQMAAGGLPDSPAHPASATADKGLEPPPLPPLDPDARLRCALSRISSLLRTPADGPTRRALFLDLAEAPSPAAASLHAPPLPSLTSRLLARLGAGEPLPGLVVVVARESPTVPAPLEASLPAPSDGLCGMSALSDVPVLQESTSARSTFCLPLQPLRLLDAQRLADSLLGAGTLSETEVAGMLLSADGRPGPLMAELEARWRAPGLHGPFSTLGDTSSELPLTATVLPTAALEALKILCVLRMPWWVVDAHALLQRGSAGLFSSRATRALALEQLERCGWVLLRQEDPAGSGGDPTNGGDMLSLRSERSRQRVLASLPFARRQQLERLAAELLEQRQRRSSTRARVESAAPGRETGAGDSTWAAPAKLAEEADPPPRLPRHADSPSSRSDGPRAPGARVLLPQKSSRDATISDVSSTNQAATGLLAHQALTRQARLADALAQHYLAAGETWRTALWAQEATLRWLDANRPGEAARSARLALEHLDPETPEFLETLVLRGEACLRAEQYAAAGEALDAAWPDAAGVAPVPTGGGILEVPRPLQARILAGRGLLAVQARRHAQARSLLQEALALLSGAPAEDSHRVTWLHTLSYLALQAQALDEADAALEQARPLVRPGTVAALDQLAREAWLLLRRHETGLEARQRAAREIPRLQGALDQALAGYQLRTAELLQNRLAEAAVVAGEPEQAVAVLTRFAEAARASFSFRAEAAARQNLGNQLLDLGRFEQAQAELLRARMLLANTQDRSGIARVHLAIADALLELARPAEARAALLDALGCLELSESALEADWTELPLDLGTLAWSRRTQLRLELHALRQRPGASDGADSGEVAPVSLSDASRLETGFRALVTALEERLPGAASLRAGALADALECSLQRQVFHRVVEEAGATLLGLPHLLTQRSRERLIGLIDVATRQKSLEVRRERPAPGPSPRDPAFLKDSLPSLPALESQALPGRLDPDALLQSIAPLLESHDELQVSEGLAGLLATLTGGSVRFIWLDAEGRFRRLNGSSLAPDELARLERDAFRHLRRSQKPWEELETLRLAEQHQRTIQEQGVRSALCWPLLRDGELRGGLYLAWPWPGVPALASVRRLVEGVASLAARWRAPVGSSWDDGDAPPFVGLEGNSPALRRFRQELHRVLNSPYPYRIILLAGEVGSGKTWLAQRLHEGFLAAHPRPARTTAVPRPARLFRHSLATSSPALLERELFGAERGAYTGAAEGPGLLELADGSTLFLDELGKCPLEIQQKLLTVLSPPYQYMRLGGMSPLTLGCRLLFAANEDLRHLCEGGKFQRDLASRLEVVLTVPPLRDWGAEGIRSVAERMLTEVLTPDAPAPVRLEDYLQPGGIAFLLQYRWPGNNRELQRLLTRDPVVLEHFRLEKKVSRAVLEARLEARGIEGVNRAPGADLDTLEFPSDWTFQTFKRWTLRQRKRFCDQALERHGDVKAVLKAWPELKQSTFYAYLKDGGEE